MKIALNLAVIYQRGYSSLLEVFSKWGSIQGILRIPVFLLLLPSGLLLTVIAVLGLICLTIAFIPFYSVQYLLGRLSARGHLQHAQKKYQRRKQRIVRREQRKRLKLSRRVDKADIQSLVKLSKNEIIGRKKYVGYRVYIQTRHRLNRCQTKMNFNDAQRIHNTIINTELKLLNETLKRLFK